MNYLETDGKTLLFPHGSIPCAMEKEMHSFNATDKTAYAKLCHIVMLLCALYTVARTNHNKVIMLKLRVFCSHCYKWASRSDLPWVVNITH